ncbi:MAG: acyl-CoA synthetase [Hyphomonadaceae bacterium]|nr:acyl-CoA synthetase [Hyphomonadaceae bacterium]GIK50138.1 MAG: acyl-CoA synthetase [Alphaproteobacteria bacterium]
MHPSVHAARAPDRLALIMGTSGEAVTFGELEAQSNRGAHLFRKLGLRIGDVVAASLENCPAFLEIAWAAQRSGLYFVAISARLTAGEVAYIVRDSGAKAVIVSKGIEAFGPDLQKEIGDVPLFYAGDAALAGARSWDAEIIPMPSTPIVDERAGGDMLYSSGTTGKPKGVRVALPEDSSLHAPTSLATIASQLFGFNEDTVYLCPAPLYHAAPLRWAMAVQKLGGTVVVMEKFDPEKALALIEKHRVTASQWVPTHFIRMLKLPREIRGKYDFSSLKTAIHAAAPCPVPVKQEMFAWWGPIIWEYYAGTEGNGLTLIGPTDWLAHPGSVGKAVSGILHICNDEGEEVPPRTEGLVYFESEAVFAYHNDPEKTAAAKHPKGWTTLGDVGWVDEQGFLYLTDRKSFMIISGGVNIYPQEIENIVVTHPKVADVAVIGAPDPEMGEKVIAVVQPLNWANATDEFRAELQSWLRPQLSGVKMPRQIDFMQELPRHPTGKLYKRLIRDSYWGSSNSRIV